MLLRRLKKDNSVPFLLYAIIKGLNKARPKRIIIEAAIKTTPPSLSGIERKIA